MKTVRHLLILCVFFASIGAHSGEMLSGTNPTVAAYFEEAKLNESALVAFLHKMPKGGDLHNHPWGAVEIEFILENAIKRGMFYDRENRILTAVRPEGPHYDVREAQSDQWKMGEIIEALSMRNYHLGDESGHDRFFRAFERFEAAVPNEEELVRWCFRRAVNQRIHHLELMNNWMTPRFRERFGEIKGEVLREFAERGVEWDFDVAYIYAIYRLTDLDVFKLQLDAAIAAATGPDAAYAAITMLGPEDGWVSQRDYAEHMRLIAAALRDLDAAHRADPDGNPPPPRFMPHSGELTMEYATYDSMRDRISSSIEATKASRIGHGTAVMWEDDVYGLLRKMRDEKIAVEIIPSSSEGILGVAGEDHPFWLYWTSGVPVVIATDDEGLSRSNLTLEYAKAARWFDLSYTEIKWLAFNSLEYSFLDGQSLFVGGNFNFPRPDGSLPERSAKAKRQQMLLDAFAEFERGMEKTIKEFGWLEDAVYDGAEVHMAG